MRRQPRIALERLKLGENKMGRPINARNIGNNIGSIRVSNHFFTGAAESGSLAFIVSIRGTNLLRVSDGTTTENLRLVNANAGALSAGECRITGIADSSTVVNVTKLRNRSVQYNDATNVQVLNNSGNVQIGGGITGGVPDADNFINIDTLQQTVP